MSILVTPFAAADAAVVEEAYRIGAAANDADLPDFPPFCHQRFVGAVRHPLPGTACHWALAYLDGAPAGYLALGLPQLDNTGNATADLVVHPAHRRRGVGRALYEHAVQVARTEGRKRITGMTCASLPQGPPRSGAGAAFAAAVGARPVLAEVRRRLDVAAPDRAEFDRLLGAARDHAAGYRLVYWRGSAPDEYVADVAYLDGRLMTDAPLGDLTWEPERIDTERVRGTERVLVERGRRTYHCAAVHEASGRLVAWTMLDLGASADWHAFQQITIVDPAHRGHRLGLLVKIENLRYALAYEPALRVVDTWNAAENTHMIAINERLGFRPVDAWTDWQQEL